MRNNNSYQLSRLPASDQSSLNARRWKGLLGVLLGASMFAAPLVRCEQEETADGNKTQETENSQEQKTKGTATQNEGALQKSSDAKGGSLLFALIGLVAILGVGAGVLLTLLLKLKARTKELEEAHAKELGKAHAKERETKAQQEKILSGSEPVHLVTQEAREFLTEFFHAISSNTGEVYKSIKLHQDQTGRLIEQSSQEAKEAQRLTEETVTVFKGQLNSMLENIQKFMTKVVEDTKLTRSEAAETKELTRNVANVLQDKEQQITELQQGYQLSLLGPLTTEFLSLRDSLNNLIQETTSDGELAAALEQMDGRLVEALGQIGVVETEIPVNPDSLAPNLWEPVSATSPTDDPGKHGTVQRIYRRGYHYHSPSGSQAVLRKAVVVLYAHPGNTETSPQSFPETPNESAPDKTNS